TADSRRASRRQTFAPRRRRKADLLASLDMFERARSMLLTSKLPRVGTTIFTSMSQLATERGAVNLGQGFPDFDGPPELHEALHRHIRAGRNQYAPMTCVPALREGIARKAEALYGCKVDSETEVTVTSGATEALFA